MMTLQAGGATENPSPSERTFVVVISPVDLSGELGLTVLWRSDVQRVMVTTVQAAIEVARVRHATMFVMGGFEPAVAAEGLRRLRADSVTRNSALAVLCPMSALDQEQSLRAAGANVILPTPVDPGATLLMLGKRNVCEPLSVHGFARCHGLTAAETRVLVELCEGTPPCEIASGLGVAISTVRTQIGNVRLKTGAASIRALVRQVAVLPPLMGVLRGGAAAFSA